MKRKRILLFILWMIFDATHRSDAAITISLSGSWSETVDSSDIIIGSEIMLPSTYTSSSSAVTMNIGANGSESWIVLVSKYDSVWDPRLHLFLRRTGNGSGNGNISGGTSFQEIGALNQTLCSGKKQLSGIPVQFQLTGITLNIPPASRSTTITYTITAP